MNVKLCGIIVLFFSLTLVCAQGVEISPQAIVVNPIPSFSVEVFVDKDPAGTASPEYLIGEAIRIGVRPSESSYVYLFNVRASGLITQILPNRFDATGASNFIEAQQTKYFPPQNARYSFTVDGPAGLDKVIAVASKTVLDTATLATFQDESSFAESNLGEAGFAQTLSIIVTPLPQANWVTDTALFYVRDGNATSTPGATPRTGTLEIRSSPSGASVYIDGTFIGQTPLRYSSTPGNYTLRLTLDGYQLLETAVSLPSTETIVLDHAFVPQRAFAQNRQDCRDNGWQVHIRSDGSTFKNQGDCISYVNSNRDDNDDD